MGGYKRDDGLLSSILHPPPPHPILFRLGSGFSFKELKGIAEECGSSKTFYPLAILDRIFDVYSEALATGVEHWAWSVFFEQTSIFDKDRHI